LSENTVRAVERALDILLCFSRQNPELTMSQIASMAEIHKSTVHRLLATLEEKHFVERDKTTGAYRLGITMLHMAYLTLEQNDLRRISHPYLLRLKDQFRETVNLSILEDADMVYLDVLESPQRVKLAAATGQRLPAFCTASGKIILAFSTEAVIERVISHGLPMHTENTIVSRQAFLENLEKIRNRGFGFSLEEFEQGINAVAAPVLAQDNTPIAAVAIAGPSFRLTKELMLEIGPDLQNTAREIAREMAIVSNNF
jgi:DNA-binding IclR family transcriptional regulator